MTDKEKLRILSQYAIFMSSVYQKNFDTFASASNVDYRLKLTDAERDSRLDLMMEYATVQGSRQRDTVEKISKLNRDNDSYTMEELLEAIDE